MNLPPPPLRRQLLKVVGAFFLTHAADIRPAWAASAPTKLQRATFAAFVDVLLPADALSVSATDLQVDDKLWQISGLDSRFHRLLNLGCTWLDMTGGAGFADLTPDQQIAVVQWMSSADWNEVPRRFYELVRQTAVEAYYSDPQAWAGLPLLRPPQPVGYPPPWQ